MFGIYAKVIVKINHVEVDRIFDYQIPHTLLSVVCVGMRVKVPFGGKNTYIEGYVVGLDNNTLVPTDRIKNIHSVLDKYPVFSQEMIDLAWWMKNKYYTTLSQCLQTIVPTGINIKNEIKVISLNIDKDTLAKEKDKLSKMESRLMQLFVLEYLEKFGETPQTEIVNNLKISLSPIKTLLKRGIIKEDILQKRPTVLIEETKKTNHLKFTEEQQLAYETISNPNGKPYLIHGVTGSGKTEIYLQLIHNIIKKGKQAIVLVPEISLTPQLSNRFLSRFGSLVAVTHSKMSHGERITVWEKVKNGQVSVIIGPRSAIFSPTENLGIIIIDEEHENTYKSDNTPKYDAREVAEFRAKKNNAILVFGTATPSLKTYYRAEKGEINLIKLLNRPFNRPLPETEIVDMRNELENGNRSIFSESLYKEINEILLKKQQAILFINRRGYSTFISCRKCGYVMNCESCNVSYTYHANSKKLMCHYCGKTAQIPTVCPQCNSKYIKYFGAGTQKVEEEVKKLFPSARVLRMDMDTTTQKNSHQNILSAFGKGEADILIGTQMIAKGHDFPSVTLVGIIAADLSLNSGDYLGAENTFQLITQVSGRAGRDALKGKVIIQTYSPESDVIKQASKSDYDEFYKNECLFRNTMNYPPFYNLFTILAFGKKENEVIEEIQKLKYLMDSLNKDKKFTILNPAPAVISKIMDNYRWRIFVKGENEDELRDFITEAIATFRANKKSTNVLLNITLNPQNMI
ncbi:MAG: primosomal protein N' [Anaerotignaceae bacterium]